MASKLSCFVVCCVLSQVVQKVRAPLQALTDYLRVDVDSGYLEIAKLWVYFVVAAHWLGCVNFMIAREFGFPAESWVVVAGLVEVEAPPEGEEGERGGDGGAARVVVAEASVWAQYSWSLHKALLQMLTIGHGETSASPPVATTCLDVASPVCASEQWVTLASLYVGFVFQAYLISQFLSILVRWWDRRPSGRRAVGRDDARRLRRKKLGGSRRRPLLFTRGTSPLACITY